MHPLYNNYVFINVTLCRKKRKSKFIKGNKCNDAFII